MSSPLDADTLAMLRELLGSELDDIVDTFLEDAPKRIEALREALAAGGDPSALERPAHTLKGAASNLGAGELTRRCAALVAACRAGVVEDAEGQVAAIAEELERVMAALRAWREGDGAPQGNRTPVSAVRGRRPRPLDEGSGTNLNRSQE